MKKTQLLLLFVIYLSGCFADIKKIDSCIPEGTLSPTTEMDLYVLYYKSEIHDSHSHIKKNKGESRYVCIYDLVENHFQNDCEQSQVLNLETGKYEMYGPESKKLAKNDLIELDGFAIKRYGIGADFGYQYSTEFRGTYNGHVVWISSYTLQRLYQSQTNFTKIHKSYFDKLYMSERLFGDVDGNKFSYDDQDAYWDAYYKIRDNIDNWDCDFEPGKNKNTSN